MRSYLDRKCLAFCPASRVAMRRGRGVSTAEARTSNSSSSWGVGSVKRRNHGTARHQTATAPPPPPHPPPTSTPRAFRRPGASHGLRPTPLPLRRPELAAAPARATACHTPHAAGGEEEDATPAVPFRGSGSSVSSCVVSAARSRPAEWSAVGGLPLSRRATNRGARGEILLAARAVPRAEHPSGATARWSRSTEVACRDLARQAPRATKQRATLRNRGALFHRDEVEPGEVSRTRSDDGRWRKNNGIPFHRGKAGVRSDDGRWRRNGNDIYFTLARPESVPMTDDGAMATTFISPWRDRARRSRRRPASRHRGGRNEM